jgi:transposase, IS5 family
LGFFDLRRRYEGLDVKDDPLVAIAAMIPWESLRPKLKASLITGGLRASDVARKSPAGRKPQAEYQLRDRLSFMRFLGLGLEDAVPDAKTLWLYREALAKAGASGSPGNSIYSFSSSMCLNRNSIPLRSFCALFHNA